MTQPIWITPSGNLGTYIANTGVSIQVHAISSASSVINYKLLNGTLPEGVSLNDLGIIAGIPKNIKKRTKFNFTVRATDGLGELSDRTFMFDVIDYGVKILTPQTTIIDTVDSVYINLQLECTNPDPNNKLIFTVSSGELPLGLYLSSDGKIFGWPTPPTLRNGSPTTNTYNFGIQAISPLGKDAGYFSIIVRNQLLLKPGKNRVPAILNNAPLVTPVADTNPDKPYYLTSRTLPVAFSDTHYSFKIIGYDFDGDQLLYQFNNLPPGLVGNPVTGWITGVPRIANQMLSSFQFSVNVCKADNTTLCSKNELYSIIVKNEVTDDLTWITPSDLGTVSNGKVLELFLTAESSNTLQYVVIDGKLPPNVHLTPNGQLIGRVPFQPTAKLKNKDENTVFTFTVNAFSTTNSYVHATRTFTLNVVQTYENPLDTLYIKAYPDTDGKTVIKSLLSDTNLIPNDWLYRPEDSNFGKAIDVRFTHMVGVETSNMTQYLSAISLNHYKKKVLLGPLQRAIARDKNNEVKYEVVFSPILDDASALSKLLWAKKFVLANNDWVTSNAIEQASDVSVYTSFQPAVLREMHPNSLKSMRNELANHINVINDQNLLPDWMISQQENGDTLGYIPAWVICYTLPGYGEKIIDNITQFWGHSLNEIDFTIDRLIVDRSMTYNWNTSLHSPNWTTLPSATPAPSTPDEYDVPILFQRETILPNVIYINN